MTTTPETRFQIKIPAKYCGPLFVLSGPFAVVFICGFVAGWLAVRRF